MSRLVPSTATMAPAIVQEKVAFVGFRLGMTLTPMLLCGLHRDEKGLVPGAQSERRGEATRPVRDLLTGETSPAVFVLHLTTVRRRRHRCLRKAERLDTALQGWCCDRSADRRYRHNFQGWHQRAPASSTLKAFCSE